MKLFEILNENPTKGDNIDLIFGDVLIETIIEDVLEDGVVIKLDEKSIKLILESNNKKNIHQGVMEGASENAWNAGIRDEDFIKKFGQAEFDRLTKKYGQSSIPVPDLYGYRAKEPTDQRVRQHRGIDGPGAKLKSIIKHANVSEDDNKNSKDESFEAYGVYGMKSKPWRKVFKNQAAFEAWLDKNEGNVEVYGTRKLKQGVMEGSLNEFAISGDDDSGQQRPMSLADVAKIIKAKLGPGWTMEHVGRTEQPGYKFIPTDKTKHGMAKIWCLVDWDKVGEYPTYNTILYSFQNENDRIIANGRHTEKAKPKNVSNALVTAQSILGNTDGALKNSVAEGYEEYKHPYGKPDRSMNARYRSEISHARNRGDYAVADEMEREINQRTSSMRGVDFERMVDELHAKLMAQKDPAKKQELQAKIDKLHDIARKGLMPESMFEAEYQGRKVSLGKPFLTPDGPKKRSVYVKNPKGNIVKVNFGQKGVKIKKNNPSRRKSFRARHNCSNPGPRHKARYWSCKFW